MKKILLLSLLFIFLPLITEGTTWTRIDFEIESLQVPARAASIGLNLDNEYRLGARSILEIVENTGDVIHFKEFSSVIGHSSDGLTRDTRGETSGLMKERSIIMVIEKESGFDYFPRLKVFAYGLEYLEEIENDPEDDPENYKRENLPTANCRVISEPTYGIGISATWGSRSYWTGFSYDTLEAMCPREMYDEHFRRNWISFGNNKYLTWNFDYLP